MKRFAPDVPDGPDVSHAFATELLVRVAVVVAFPFALWVVADPVVALLTVTVFALAGLLVVGVVGGDEADESER